MYWKNPVVRSDRDKITWPGFFGCVKCGMRPAVWGSIEPEHNLCLLCYFKKNLPLKDVIKAWWVELNVPHRKRPLYFLVSAEWELRGKYIWDAEGAGENNGFEM